MNVTIDRDGCIGCGVCATVCPEVFRMAEDGRAEVYAQPQAQNEAGARDAAGQCPVSVISAQ